MSHKWGIRLFGNLSTEILVFIAKSFTVYWQRGFGVFEMKSDAVVNLFGLVFLALLVNFVAVRLFGVPVVYELLLRMAEPFEPYMQLAKAGAAMLGMVCLLMGRFLWAFRWAGCFVLLHVLPVWVTRAIGG